MVLLYIASALDVVHLSHMVTLIETNWNLIREEILRWLEILRPQHRFSAMPVGM